MSMTTTLIREKGTGINHYKSYEVTVNTHTIKTLVTASPSQVGQWLATNTRNPDHRRMIVGLDVERRLNTEPNRVATIQLCIGHNCLIFQILHAPSIPRAFTSFLANPDVKFVGFGVQDDADKLQRDYNLEVTNAVDLGPLAEQELNVLGLQTAGLAALGNFVLVGKPHYITMSDWENRFLTHDQVQYAAIDAFLSSVIGRTLIP